VRSNDERMGRLKRAAWLAVALGLCAFAIPWFLWNDATIVAGLPLWLWWHVGWMVLASVVFWLFAEHAWGLGIESDGGSNAGTSVDAGGERQ
jgi:hypothetical protein